MTTKIKDLETIIEIQEKIIEANKKENDILEDCLKKSYEREDNMKQWAFWYRAFSEYLEQCIQVFIKTKKKTIFSTHTQRILYQRNADSLWGGPQLSCSAQILVTQKKSIKI